MIRTLLYEKRYREVGIMCQAQNSRASLGSMRQKERRDVSIMPARPASDFAEYTSNEFALDLGQGYVAPIR
jgi:hypothetical protein